MSMQLLISPCLIVDHTARRTSQTIPLPAAQPVLNQVDNKHGPSSAPGVYLPPPPPNINPDDEFPRRAEISDGKYILRNNGTTHYAGVAIGSRSLLPYMNTNFAVSFHFILNLLALTRGTRWTRVLDLFTTGV